MCSNVCSRVNIRTFNRNTDEESDEGPAKVNHSAHSAHQQFQVESSTIWFLFHNHDLIIWTEDAAKSTRQVKNKTEILTDKKNTVLSLL